MHPTLAAWVSSCALVCIASFPRRSDASPIAQEGVSKTKSKPTQQNEEENEPEGGEVILIAPSPLPDIPSPSQRLVSQDVLELTPRRSADDLLRTVPGLHISQHAAEGKAQQFFLRGFDAIHGSDLALSVEGIPINEPSNVHGHGYLDIGFLMPEVVRSLNTSKGSFRVGQGDFATAGSVDLELGVAAPRRGQRLSYELGSTNRHRTIAVVAPENLPDASFVAIEGMSDRGFGQHRTSERIGLLGQHRFELGAGLWLQALAAGYSSRFDEPGTVPLADVEAGHLGFYDTYNRLGEGASTRGLVAARVHKESRRERIDAGLYAQARRLRLAENFTGFLSNPDMGDLRAQSHEATTLGAHGTAHHRLGGAFTLVGVATARLDRLAQTEEQLDEMGIPWRDNRDLEASLFAGDAGTALRFERRGLEVEAGARLATLWIGANDTILSGESRSQSMVVPVPRISASYRASTQWMLFAGYGHGLRSPEARAVAVSDGDEVRFTTSRNAELGIEARLPKNTTFGATSFATWIDDEFIFDHLAGTSLTRNATRRLGMELSVESQPTYWLRLRGDATAVDAKFTESGSPVPRAPTLLARTEAQLRHSSGLRGGMQLAFMGPRPLSNGATGEGFAVIDLIAGYRFGNADMTLQVDNALASKVREGEFHYASRFREDQPISLIPRLHYSAGRPFGVRATLTAWF